MPWPTALLAALLPLPGGRHWTCPEATRTASQVMTVTCVMLWSHSAVDLPGQGSSRDVPVPGDMDSVVELVQQASRTLFVPPVIVAHGVGVRSSCGACSSRPAGFRAACLTRTPLPPRPLRRATGIRCSEAARVVCRRGAGARIPCPSSSRCLGCYGGHVCLTETSPRRHCHGHCHFCLRAVAGELVSAWQGPPSCSLTEAAATLRHTFELAPGIDR